MWLERMIETRDGARIATECLGRESDPPVLLSMGATASMLWWPDAFCEGIAALGHRVIRYDHRDTGQSTTGKPGHAAYTVANLRDDIFDILDAYDIDRAHLVGMSLGGYLAQLAGLGRPDRILSLTLIASEPVGGVTEALPGMGDDILGAFSELSMLDWGDAAAVEAKQMHIARLCTGPGRVFDEPGTLRRVRGEMRRSPDISSAFNHATMEVGDIGTPRIQDIIQPVLVIHGSHDPVLPVENGLAIADHAASAEILVLNGAGHEINPADTGQMVDRIGRFLRPM